MGSLADAVKDMNHRRQVVDDCVALIEAEVSDKRGLSGMAIKAAFKTVKGVRPGMIGMAMDGLLDDFASQLDPFWVDCQSQDEPPRSFFVARGAQIANALLSITDQRANVSHHRVLVRAYKGLRPKAIEHIKAAMPRFADLLVKHAS